MEKNFFDYTVKAANGENFPLKEFQNKVVLVVNVASKCGFTPQYSGLESLYKEYKDKGFVVLGFPCNQFGAQEPGNAKEIQNFCSLNYQVSFPIFAKIDVNGANADPIYEFLKSQAPGLLGTEMIKWNFTKFLIDRKGQVIERYSPQTEPASLKTEIEKALS